MISDFPLVRIGNIVDAISTCNPSTLKTTSSFEYVDISSINRDSKQIEGTTVIPVNDAPSRARQIIKSHDILVSTVRPNLNAVAQVPPRLNDQIASTGFTVLRPQKLHLDDRYLFHWVKSPAFVSHLSKEATGASYPAVSDKIVKDTSIPLPPLGEQKRIAEVLDKADALRQKRRRALQKLDTLLQSVFLEMFGDPVRNPKGWDTRTLPELILPGKNSLKRGPFGGTLKKEIFVDSGYLVYEQYHALNNDYSFGRYFITEEKYKELIGFSVKPNDIIISCSGVYLGKLSIVPDGAKPGIINQALLKVSLDQEKMKTVVFAYIFGSSQFKRKYFPSNRGVAIPNLPPMDVMKKIGFITPPLEIQQKFADNVNRIYAIKKRYEIGTTSLENLFSSIRNRAFKGELFETSMPSVGFEPENAWQQTLHS